MFNSKRKRIEALEAAVANLSEDNEKIREACCLLADALEAVGKDMEMLVAAVSADGLVKVKKVNRC